MHMAWRHQVHESTLATCAYYVKASGRRKGGGPNHLLLEQNSAAKASCSKIQLSPQWKLS